MIQSPPRPLLVRVEEAAGMLGIGRTQAWALVACGELPSVRIGKKSVRVPVDGLERWVQAHTEVAT